MRYTIGSLFAGIGGFDLAFERAGFEVAWHVEIDANCRKLLAYKYPGADAFEDVRTVGKQNLKPVDVICGGFPCQDLSVAGKRAGLAGERSGLFFEMVRIINELRPTFVLWENVPGLLSSNRGKDFLVVLLELERIGYHGAWTTLDARWFGVPQRRRRVFGAFARGDIGAGPCAEILSLQARMSGDFTPGTAARQSTPPTTGNDVEADSRIYQWASGGGDDLKDSAQALRANAEASYQVVVSNGEQVANPLGAKGSGWRGDLDNDTFVGAFNFEMFSGMQTNVAPALQAQRAKDTLVFDARGNGDGLTAPTLTGDHNDRVTDFTAVVFQQNQRDEVRDLGKAAGAVNAQSGMHNQNFIAFSTKDHGADAQENIAPTLRAMNYDKSRIGGGGSVAIAFDWQAGDGGADDSFRGKSRSYIVRKGDYAQLRKSAVDAVAIGTPWDAQRARIHDAEGQAPTLQHGAKSSGNIVPSVAYNIQSNDRGKHKRKDRPEGGLYVNETETALTVGTTDLTAIKQNSGVRRLTPLECTRLQGFPDSWLEDIQYGTDEEARAGAILQFLWCTVGEEARKGRGLAIESTLLPPKILLAGVHGGWVSWQMAIECASRGRQIQGEKYCSEGFLRRLREAKEFGCSPYQRESFGQLAGELGCTLSELPLEEAQAAKALLNSELWEIVEKEQFVRQTFPTGETRKALNLSDSVRYRMLGNAVCVPVVEWIARRAFAVLEKMK